jgi:hypothetical protein
MRWFAWRKICVPKKSGGMGFRDIHCYNLALLAKQCWRLIEQHDSLCARVLRAKYYPADDILSIGLKKSIIIYVAKYMVWSSDLQERVHMACGG